MTTFKPTYLYIKQHSVTGKLYFGKTIRDPETYIGSGIHWLNHIKKHGRQNVVNLWYCLFLDEQSINQFALDFSEQQRIVESDDWLNMIPENGLNDDFQWNCGKTKYNSDKVNEVSKKISASLTGKQKSDIHKANMRKPKSQSHREKMSEVRIGKPLSEEHKANMRRPKSEEHKKKLAIAATGNGRPHEIVQCPHCGKIGGKGCMKRWHFDNCKENKNVAI